MHSNATEKDMRATQTRSDMRAASDAPWIIPFFTIIATGIAFFFWQMAQYGLLPH
jgi:hypothetical protein